MYSKFIYFAAAGILIITISTLQGCGSKKSASQTDSMAKPATAKDSADQQPTDENLNLSSPQAKKDVLFILREMAKDCSRCDLSGAELSGMNLTGANLEKTNLGRANLSNSILRRANLRGANLQGADLKGANLMGADLRGAIITGADMTGANLTGAKGM